MIVFCEDLSRVPSFSDNVNAPPTSICCCILAVNNQPTRIAHSFPSLVQFLRRAGCFHVNRSEKKARPKKKNKPLDGTSATRHKKRKKKIKGAGAPSEEQNARRKEKQK